jgi:hypothetical protein
METLLEFNSSPFLNPLPIADLPMKKLGNLINSSYHVMGEERPDFEALRFYLMNHAVAVAQSRVIGGDEYEKYASLFSMYLDNGVDIATRLFYYLILICTRESRHLNSGTYRDAIEQQESALSYWWCTKVASKGSHDAQMAFRINGLDVSMGEYTIFLWKMFTNGRWNSGYGGAAWAKVAAVLHRFVHGEISAETMVDTGFTLAHNNGPIFNKGMLYQGYYPSFMSLLDVQRAGKIPQLVQEWPMWQKALSYPALPALILVVRDTIRSVLGNAFGSGGVDWLAVQEAGAISNLHYFIELQTGVEQGSQKPVKVYYFITPQFKLPVFVRKHEENKVPVSEFAWGAVI